MRRWRATKHENRVQRAWVRRRVSLCYKQPWMAVAWRSESPRTSIPSVRLTRAGKGTTFCRTHKLGRTNSSVCNRPATQQSPPFGRCHANLGRTWLWIGCASGNRGGLLLIVLESGKAHKQVRTFGTTTRDLVSLREWLSSEGCTHVAMESTGVYWKPIYAILEGAFEIVVANAHVKKSRTP